jgi:predicted nuclease with TOPRIM domain
LRLKNLRKDLIILLSIRFFSLPCEVCGTLKGKLLHATKENFELKQEVAYLSSRLERTIVSEKMIEEDLSRVEESTTKSTYKLGVGFERCEDKGQKSACLFLAPIITKRKNHSNQPKPTTHPIPSHPSTPRAV